MKSHITLDTCTSLEHFFTLRCATFKVLGFTHKTLKKAAFLQLNMRIVQTNDFYGDILALYDLQIDILRRRCQENVVTH